MFDDTKEPLRGFPVGLRRVGVYLRKSREDHEEERKARAEGRDFDTLSKHRGDLLAIAQRQQYTILRIHAEVVSGESIHARPEVQALLSEIGNGDYDAVLCMDIDRLGRGDMADQGRILSAFKDSQTLIITPDKVFDLDDEIDEEVTEMRAFFSRKEYKIIKKRLERGRHRSIRQGKFIYPRPPYGYERGEESVLRIHPEQAKIIHLIFNWYIAGYGPTMIANRLTTLKIPSPLGKSNWWSEQIVFMLRNPVYQGQIRHRHQQRGRIKKRPEEIYEGRHEALVDPDTFARVQNMIGRPSAPGPKRPKNPLRGLILCAYCNRPYQYMPARGGNIERLHCDTNGCPGGSLNIGALEDVILTRLRKYYDDIAVEPEQEPMDRSGVDVVERQLAETSQEISQVDIQRSNAFDLLERGVYTVEVFEDRQRLLSARQTELDARMRTLEHEREVQEQILTERTHWIPSLVRVLDLYTQLSHPDAKNDLLREIVDHAVIRKKKSARAFELELFLRLPVRGEPNA